MKPAFNLNRIVIYIALPLCGLWFIGHGSYIHAKALLAQLLLEAAWTKTVHGKKEVKPWPWADTWPVARLSVPRLGLSRIVLAGANGSSFAFGPGHFFHSASPGEHGNVVIAGHRDTHFQFLQNLNVGDVIHVEGKRGELFVYRVDTTYVTEESNTTILDRDLGSLLTLITCYPFDAIDPGSPRRFVVEAGRTGQQRYL